VNWLAYDSDRGIWPELGVEWGAETAECGRPRLFEQLKENISLTKEFTGTVRDGLTSARAAWPKATPEKRAIWLLVPTVVVVSAVAEHFSAPWYYEVAVLASIVALVCLGSGMRRAMRRRLP
jgi:hypothetical protein